MSENSEVGGGRSMSVTRGFDWCDLAIERGLARGAAAVEAFYLESRSVEVMVEKNDIHVPKGDRQSGIGLRVLMASDDVQAGVRFDEPVDGRR